MKTSGAEALKSYLLGNLEESRRSQLEERLLNDSEFFEELLISEDELVDNYVAGRLTDLERKRFESHFLITPDRHRKFQFGRALNKYLEINDETKSQHVVSFQPRRLPRRLFNTQLTLWPVQKTAIAFSLIALLGVGSLVFYRTFVRRSLNDSPTYVVSLFGGATRSAGSGLNRISIPANTSTVELHLAVAETNYQNYVAEVRSDQGKITEVRSATSVEQNGQRSIVFLVPADSIPPNDYLVKLRGIAVSGEEESISEYSFRILPR